MEKSITDVVENEIDKKPAIDVVEITILKLLEQNLNRHEIAEILDFDPALAFSALVEKGYLYSDLKIRKGSEAS